MAKAEKFMPKLNLKPKRNRKTEPIEVRRAKAALRKTGGEHGTT